MAPYTPLPLAFPLSPPCPAIARLTRELLLPLG